MAAHTAAAPAPRPLAQRTRLLLVAVAAMVAGLFVWLMLAATEGHFVPQVVDLYLVCQYARAMAEGHPFRYNAGDPPSTGATSLLHTMALALAHAVGIRGEGLIAFAIATGAALYAGSVLLARAVAARLAGPREGLLGGMLVALGGPVVWSFLYGSDIALFLFLALWLLERWLASADAGRPLWAVPAVLLALARPEGLPIALALAVLWCAGHRRPAATSPRVWSPVAAGLGVLVLYRALTGSWLGTSVSDKSLFASYGLDQGLALVSEYLVDLVRGLLLGLYPSQVPIGMGRGWASLFFPPLALAAMAATVVFSPQALRRAAAAWLALTAAMFVLVAPSVFLGAHFQRYVLWAFPGLLALAAAGLGQATRFALGADPARERAAFRAVAVVWVGLAALSTLRFASLYGEMAADVYRRDVAAARWILRSNIPPGTPIANLAMSVEYLTGHRNLNLHGVTSPAFFGDHAAEREADAFEGLGRLSPPDRPPYLIATVSMLDRFPAMRALVSGPPLFRSASFGDEIEIYRTQYDLLGRGAEPWLPATLAAVKGLAEVDHINVCDSREEAAHGYAFASAAGTARLWGTVRIDRYPGTDETVADGGRAIFGHESFRVAAQPDRDLLLVLRTAPTIDANLLEAAGPRRVGIEFPEAALMLSVDGQPIGRPTSYRMQPGWNELTLRVTGNLVRGARPRLEVSGRYASFRYWVYQ